MTRILPVNLKTDTRHILVLVALVANVLRIMISLTMLVSAWYVRHSFTRNAPFLVTFYSSQTVPSILYVTGCLAVVASFFGVYVLMRSKLHEGEKNMEIIRKINYLLLTSVIFSVLLIILIFITSMIVYAHIWKVEEALTQSLSTSLLQYRTKPEVKITVDKTQIRFACCGVNDYEDWFKVPWIDRKYINTKEPNVVEKKGEFYTENVPFSCCDSNYPGECHNNLVRSNRAHYRYDYRVNLTLHRRGCRDALMEFFGGIILTGVGSFFVSTLILEIFVCIVSRYVQTSILSEFKEEEPIQGWLIQWKKEKKQKKKSETVAPREEEYDNDTEEIDRDTDEEIDNHNNKTTPV